MVIPGDPYPVLVDARAGDMVVVYDPSSRPIRRVARVRFTTPLQVVIQNGDRFWKDSGSQVGIGKLGRLLPILGLDPTRSSSGGQRGYTGSSERSQ